MRHPAWEQRLSEYLNSQEQSAFEWGVNDCCNFAAACAEAVTGVGFGSLYPCGSAADAALILKRNGGVEGIADNHYKRQSISFAQRGDIVAAQVSKHGLSLGICRGIDAVFKSLDGLVLVNMSVVKIAWRVE